MPAVNPKNLEYEGIRLHSNDFTAGDEEGTTISETGRVVEIAVAEVGEDGQLSSYDAIRLGDRPVADDPTKGKLYMALQDSVPEDIPNTTEVRFSFRDKNSNRRLPATPWLSARDLDRDRPDHRHVLRPRVRNGNPWYLKMGRLLVLEAKNEAESFEISLSNSEIDVPARGGY